MEADGFADIQASIARVRNKSTALKSLLPNYQGPIYHVTDENIDENIPPQLEPHLLDSEVPKEQADINALRQENKGLKAEVDALKTSKKGLKADVDSLKVENGEMEKRLRAITGGIDMAMIKGLKETIESLMRDLSDAITERDDALKANQLLTDKSESLIEALNNSFEESKAKEESEMNLREEVTSLRQVVDALRQQAKELRENKKHLEGAMLDTTQAHQKELEQLRTRLVEEAERSSNEKAAAFDEVMQNTATALRTAKLRLIETTEKAEKEKARSEKLTHDLEALRAELRSFQALAELAQEANERYEVLTHDLESLRAELRALGAEKAGRESRLTEEAEEANARSQKLTSEKMTHDLQALRAEMRALEAEHAESESRLAQEAEKANARSEKLERELGALRAELREEALALTHARTHAAKFEDALTHARTHAAKFEDVAAKLERELKQLVEAKKESDAALERARALELRKKEESDAALELARAQLKSLSEEAENTPQVGKKERAKVQRSAAPGVSKQHATQAGIPLASAAYAEAEQHGSPQHTTLPSVLPQQHAPPPPASTSATTGAFAQTWSERSTMKDTVLISIKGARNLPPRDKYCEVTTLRNPFIVLSLRNGRFRTSVAELTVNPVFNQHLMVSLSDDPVVLFEVWDDDLSGEGVYEGVGSLLLGSAVLSGNLLAAPARGREAAVWLPLMVTEWGGGEGVDGGEQDVCGAPQILVSIKECSGMHQSAMDQTLLAIRTNIYISTLEAQYRTPRETDVIYSSASMLSFPSDPTAAGVVSAQRKSTSEDWPPSPRVYEVTQLANNSTKLQQKVFEEISVKDWEVKKALAKAQIEETAKLFQDEDVLRIMQNCSQGAFARGDAVGGRGSADVSGYVVDEQGIRYLVDDRALLDTQNNAFCVPAREELELASDSLAATAATTAATTAAPVKLPNLYSDMDMDADQEW